MASYEPVPPQQNPGQPVARTTGNQAGLSTAALVLGIVSIPTAVFPAIVGIITGVIAIVLGVMGRRTGNRNARIGLVLGIIGLVVGVVNSFFGALLFSGRLG